MRVATSVRMTSSFRKEVSETGRMSKNEVIGQRSRRSNSLPDRYEFRYEWQLLSPRSDVQP
jgi:hypothetical protein